MVIRQADAEARHVATLSDAGVYQRGWELGAGYEFIERPDGLKGLARTYGLRLREQPRTMDLGLLYAAMEEGSVDMVAGNATDGQLTSPQFVALKDDRHYFPPYQAAYVVRDATLGKFPKLEAALRELSGKLDDKRMRELNYQLEGLHRSGPKVVAEWLSKMDGAK
jgi:osmoprotectant transport system substrate-binding protein